MTKSEKIRLFYGIFLGVFTVVLGVIFIFEAADLYYSGVAETGAETGMYSVEVVSQRLLALLAPVILWILAVIAGFVLFEIFPAEQKRLHANFDSLTIFNRFKKRVPRIEEGENSKLYADYARKEKLRLAVRIACAAFVVLAAVMCAVYVFNAANFSGEDLSAEVLGMLKNVLPWLGAAFVVLAGCTVFELVYAKKMLPAVKKLIAAGKGMTVEPTAFEKKKAQVGAFVEHKHTVLAIRIALLTVAVVFIIVGATLGEAQVMWIKAINICTECIGLG